MASEQAAADTEDHRRASRYQSELEKQAVKAVLPANLEDDLSLNLKQELMSCLARNDWYFSIGKAASRHVRT